jgi:hypothetical protein
MYFSGMFSRFPPLFAYPKLAGPPVRLQIRQTWWQLLQMLSKLSGSHGKYQRNFT